MEMDITDSEENKCLICLEDNASVHWNAVLYGYSDLTYKDCYYKYTQLEDFDTNDSTMFCRNCSNGLEYIDAFITKAIESHVLLRERFSCNIAGDDEENIKDELMKVETILIEESEIKFESQYDTANEDCTEEVVMKAYEKDTCSSSDTEILGLKHTRKRRKLKSANKKMKNIGNSADKTSSEKLAKKFSINDQPICCTICSKVLSSKYKAIRHEKTHIENRERNETCVECGLKFFSKEILKNHMKTHSENREKSHKCEFCDKAFYNKSGLNIHRRIHLGQMISCSLCTKEFYRQIDLDKHMNSHSAVRINSTIKTKTKCFIRCKYCGKNVQSTNFKFHNAKHLNEPLFKCTICNKEFFHRDSCAKHLKRTHKKPNGDVNNFIIAYKSNRLSRLYLQQNANIIDPCE